MRRRPRVERTARGEGRIALTIVVADMIEASGVGTARFLELVRDGMLDAPRRPDRFNTMAPALTAYQGRGLPTGLPELEGVVSWRRRERRWSLDVTHGLIGPGIHWWESVRKGSGDAQLRLEAVNLPEAAHAGIEGRPLREVVAHPLLADDRIVIRRATSHPPTDIGMGPRPGSVEFMLDVPRIEMPD